MSFLMRKHVRIYAGAALIPAVAVLLWAAWSSYARPLPKRFGAVVPGRLYRCGDVAPRELEYAVRTYGVRTVLSLLNPDVPASIEEREVARRLGLRWENVPLPGNGASTPEERERIKRVLFDPEAGPLLVHCAAGSNRTGLAVGMYRIHREGWSVEDVLREMRRYAFEDLPKHDNLRAALRLEWLEAQARRERSVDELAEDSRSEDP